MLIANKRLTPRCRNLGGEPSCFWIEQGTFFAHLWRLRFPRAYVILAALCPGYVATPGGWRPVEALAVGDALLTFDGGAQTLTGVGRSLLWTPIEQCPPELWPIVVPAGAVGNRCRMRALPGTRFLVESDLAEQITGDPFCVIPAASLIDAGIATQEPPTSFVEIMTLTFDSEQLVYSDGGALIMSDLPCPANRLMWTGFCRTRLACVFTNWIRRRKRRLRETRSICPGSD